MTPVTHPAPAVHLEGVSRSYGERTLFRRRHIGFVYQFFNLIPTLIAADNLGLPLELNRVGEAQI